MTEGGAVSEAPGSEGESEFDSEDDSESPESEQLQEYT
jgi:hypothetical protein